MGIWNDTWNWYNERELERDLQNVIEELEEFRERQQFINDFLRLRGISLKEMEEYIDSRKVAEKLAEEV